MNAQEWKGKTRKTLTLKSGLEVTVRRMSPWAISEHGQIPGLDVVEERDQTKVARAILLGGIVSPKFGDGPDEISLLDLDSEDTSTLIDAIIGVQKQEGGLPLGDTASPGGQPS
jgi:hypothetical protein